MFNINYSFKSKSKKIKTKDELSHFKLANINKNHESKTNFHILPLKFSLPCLYFPLCKPTFLYMTIWILLNWIPLAPRLEQIPKKWNVTPLSGSPEFICPQWDPFSVRCFWSFPHACSISPPRDSVYLCLLPPFL